MFREIEIKDNTQVEKINQLACQTPYEVWLSTDTLMLDARSLLGLFALKEDAGCCREGSCHRGRRRESQSV